MPIRSGTGGLKYPLPNFAQLNAQQSAAAASSGGSASASAYGTNRQFTANKMRIQADLANSAAERDFRARSQMEGQNFRAQQEFYDREHQAGAQLEAQRAAEERQAAQFQQQTELQLGQQGFAAGQADLEREFTLGRDQTRYAQDQAAFEQEQDAGIQAGIRAGKLELPWEAQAKLQKLDADRAAIASQQNLSPEQRAEFERKAEEQERALLRTARAPRTPSATDRAQQGVTYFDPQQGRFAGEMGPGRIPGSVGQKGEFQPIVQQPDTSKDDAKRLAEEEKRAREYMKDAEETGKPMTPEAAMKKARTAMLEEQAGFDKARNPPAATTGPGEQWQGPHPQATTEDQFTKGWATLQPGGSMVGPDGKLYVKKKPGA